MPGSTQVCAARHILTASALVAIGCSEPTLDRTAHARIDTLPDGRIRVTNTGEPSWTEETSWRLEEDLRLGTADDDGPAEEQFGRLFQITTDSRGRIYVLDVFIPAIRVFEADGSYAFDVGSPGEGPGELAMPVELSVSAGDTLWVGDQGTARYSIFAPAGTFARALLVPNFLWSLRGRALPGGRYVQWGMLPDDDPGRVALVPIRVGPAAQIVDKFPPIEFTQRLMEGDRPAVFFSPGPTGAVAADGSIWFAHADAYEIHRRTLEGDTILTFSLPAEPHPLEAADREWVAEQLSRSPTPLRDAYLAALPELRPIVDAVIPDGAGHVYVLADVAGSPAGTTLDVFADSGTYLGRLELPAPASKTRPVLHATRDHLYVVTTDELDVPYVSRLRILRE